MIRLLFFGRLGDLASDIPAQMALSETNGTPEKIRDSLQAKNAELYRELNEPQVLVAVNQQVCDWQKTLQEGDEVAFLPPVTGG